MNPEDNNPLSNPFATGSANNNFDPMAGMSNTPVSDPLASAQDSLMSTSMATNSSPSGALGFDPITPTEPSTAALPPVEEPLVPAAPVPGSIGSAVSVPPADPVAAPDLGATTPASTPTPEASPAPAPAPFNPFAASSATSTQPAATSTSSLSSAPVASAPQPAPAPVPMGAQPKAKGKFSPLTLILATLAVLLLVASIAFFILWNEEKGNIKTIYVPQVSEEDTNSAITILSCSRNESRENPNGTGSNSVTLSYIGDNLSAYSSSLSLNFGSEDDANLTRDNNASTVETMAALVGGSLSVTGEANGTNYTYTIASQDGTDLATNDVMNVIYGTTEGAPSLALGDVQAKYEAEGFVCEVEE